MNITKICWLASYPISLLLPELKTTRLITSESTMWLVYLSEAISNLDNYELHIITHSSKIPYDQYIIKNKIHFHIVRYVFIKDKGYPNYLPINVASWYPSLVRKILRILEEIRPALVHAHGTEDVFSLAALRSKLPNLTSIQGIITEYLKINFSLWHFLQQPIEKFCIKHNNNFGCRTSWDSTFVKSLNKNALIFYSPEAISQDFFKENWRGVNNLTKLIFVGNLIKRKGIETLIEVVYKLRDSFKDINVTMIGDGPFLYVDGLRKKIKDLGIEERFKFKGFLKSPQIAEELISSGIYILPTYMDNSPNSLCEAMAVGMPVIASNVGGIPSLINNGENGLLFEAGNADDLYHKIKLLLKNKELAIKIAANAATTAMKRNYPESVAKRTLEIYNEILNFC